MIWQTPTSSWPAGGCFRNGTQVWSGLGQAPSGSSQNGVQQNGSAGSQDAEVSLLFSQTRPGLQALLNSQASLATPLSPEASSTHRKSPLENTQTSSSGQPWTSGSHFGEQRNSASGLK